MTSSALFRPSVMLTTGCTGLRPLSTLRLLSLTTTGQGHYGRNTKGSKSNIKIPQSSIGTHRSLSNSNFKASLPSRPCNAQHTQNARQQFKYHSTISHNIGANKTMKNWEVNLDPVQKKSLEEECILLDDNDKVIGSASKKNCHLIQNGDILLHRAFSVFLFNSKGELLLQQRSKTKITFPLLWTNTCCSHPLSYPDELIETEATGVKIAAKRRMEIELGISPTAININEFHYITRIHYKASSSTIWGEHEIDYILFLQKDIEIQPNPDEVAETRYVSLDQISEMSLVEGVQLTPWFELIYKSWLPRWWNNLNSLEQFDDHKSIHKM